METLKNKIDEEGAKQVAWKALVWITVIAMITSPIAVYLV